MQYAVIMAGGSGARLWPASRKIKPKQFFSFDGDKSMLRVTAERVSEFTGEKNILVVTGSRFVADTLNHIPFINRKQIISEPVAKNTAPCIAAAAAKLFDIDSESVMIVLPSDHHIENTTAFIKTIEKAVEVAEEKKSLVTIGIEPGYPETGFGYIETEKKCTGLEKLQEFSVKSFTEKPDRDTAIKFLKSGRYLWNSGIFVWKTSVIINAFKKYQPLIYEQAKQLVSTGFSEGDLISFYSSCPAVSIDYGIMEKASNIDVIPGDFGWNDIGNWKSIYNLKAGSENENVSMAKKVVFEDSKSSLAFSKSDKLIVFSGVENICLVDTGDAILVLNMDKAQNVKSIVGKLKENDNNNPFL